MKGIVLIAIITIVWFIVGVIAGISTYFHTYEPIIIENVSFEDGHWKYKTNMFYFRSDSIFQVGDTIKIVKQ